MPEATTRVNRLIDLAKSRIAELDQTLAHMSTVERSIQQAAITREGIQQPERFSRYQATINRQLYEALERLEAMQERKHKGSMGSFGEQEG